ncbi:MOSC domain-containing protein [Flaviramulus aquimarinus]|uniref:MOSC domain-containing protein n=1 Tax=Flaviramulus aquimarinus TaxID=1170456 RepID=A0ABP9FFL8_9FLAO
MKIISTNIAKPTTITWNDQEITTGIYKKPTSSPIYLGTESVKGDEVSNRSIHGGKFKACYLFSEVHYQYWKYLYPNLDWNWGMFGENLTVSDLDETQIYIGDIYRIGETLVQVTQPREPCVKFGVKFGSQRVLKEFIDHGFSGTYVRVLEEGFVKTGDTIKLIEHKENSLTTAQFFNLLFAKNKNRELIEKAIMNDALPQRKRDKLKQYIKQV